MYEAKAGPLDSGKVALPGAQDVFVGGRAQTRKEACMNLSFTDSRGPMDRSKTPDLKTTYARLLPMWNANLRFTTSQ